MKRESWNIGNRSRVPSTVETPNPFRVAWSVFRARRAVPPVPHGTASADHTGLEPILQALAEGGTPALALVQGDLDRYLAGRAAVDPATLNRSEELAFWLNLYNAGALSLAAQAFAEGAESVLRVPGGFAAELFDIATEQLSLDAIEHGKIRRFGDPRIHAALVCGSVSCPTLRYEPYRGDRLGAQLDDQMRRFLTGGGAHVDRDTRTVHLSRVFLWYGGDFTRPHRMPTWIPSRRPTLVRALLPWLDEATTWVASGKTTVRFQPYDWGLRCSVG
ncbi:MAG: DUF547 domain-containing protein [Acidimicrobiia bacterium]|nr:DUF547 domain-containing protein [Acidimicrobiia bacterium]MDH3398863.1 DUF547 domain-containing protein [Acidimicrobiia bacterium]MDH5615006.1 DUF547 domain-containing protein [Acidimicrobiia bacterium]